MQRFISMFEHTPPGKAESAGTRHGSNEDLKLTRAELELRKCLGNDTQEPLIKSYSCAWQKEILVQGHLHVTPNWFCFYSNFLGWETKTCISCQDVTAVEKHKAARVFPTAVVIATGDKKYRFVSFVHRNRSYQVISVVWQNSLSEHPLSTKELVQHLKDIKDKKERTESASPLLIPQSLNLGSKNNVSDYTADSSDPEQHIFSSNPSSPSSSFPPILGRLDDHETTTTTTTTPSTPTEQLATTTTQDSNSTSSARSTPSQTDGTETIFLQDSSASSSHVETGSDTATLSSDSIAEEKEVFLTHCSRSASLIVLQPESETGEEGKAAGTKGLQGGSCDDASDVTIGRSCLQRLGGCLLHPGESFRKGWNYSSLIAVYQRIRGVGSCLAHTCTLSNVLNLIIALSIVVLLISTLSMVCKLSRVEPALQPYLSWQPWCKLCLADEASYSNGNQATEKPVILTKDIFESMINKHPPGQNSDIDSSSALPNDDDVPF